MRSVMMLGLACLLSGCVFVAGGRPDSRVRVDVDDAAAAPAGQADVSPSREHLAPAGWEDSYHRWHYSPVVKVGDQVIVSGIPAGRGATYEEKVRNLFRDLERHLASAGASMDDVVELTSWHVGATDNAAFTREFETFSKVHAEFFTGHYPAWSAVGTTALLSPTAVVELRAVAVIGSGRAPRADIPQPAPPPPAQP